jgi:hypothetical protein
VIYWGERTSLPWGELAGPAEALLWFRGAHPASRILRLPLGRRMACYAACQARLDVASGGRGTTTLATALYGWPDARDIERMGELEDEEVAVMATRFSLEREQLVDALRISLEDEIVGSRP